MSAFDPEIQFEQLLNETDEQIAAIAARFDRLRWLRSRIAERFKELQAKADAIEIYTEEQLADKLQLKVEQLAYLRRTMNLPYTPFGSKVRYTRRDADAILELLSTRNRRASSRKAA